VPCTTPAGTDRALGAIPYAVQWVKRPPGASGSVTTSASSRVPAGGADQRSGGATPAPEHVWRVGIVAPSRQGPAIASAFGALGGACAEPPQPSVTRAIWQSASPMAKLHALRGATTVDRNDAEAIVGATEWLMREIMKRNDLVPDTVVSCIFTLTDDLDAEFPAVAARRLGFEHVPLLCAREIPVPGSLPRVIRVLMHYYADDDEHEPKHVYLGDARNLRADLESAQ
jgi:chorismate mutase